MLSSPILTPNLTLKENRSIRSANGSDKHVAWSYVKRKHIGTSDETGGNKNISSFYGLQYKTERTNVENSTFFTKHLTRLKNSLKAISEDFSN